MWNTCANSELAHQYVSFLTNKINCKASWETIGSSQWFPMTIKNKRHESHLAEETKWCMQEWWWCFTTTVSTVTHYFFFLFKLFMMKTQAAAMLLNQINNNGTWEGAKSLTMHDMSHAHSPESVDTNSALTLGCEREMLTPDAVWMNNYIMSNQELLNALLVLTLINYSNWRS